MNHLKFSAAILLSLLCVADPLSADAQPDSIVGQWRGSAGTELDRVELGFEFKRNDSGELKVYLYQPVINFYGLELPGALVREADKYSDAEAGLTFEVSGDKLQGSYLAPSIPMILERSQALPAEVAVPELPLGPGPKWTATLGGAIYARPAVYSGIAYVGTTGGVLHAIYVDNGKFVWTFVAGRPIHGEPLATDQHIYFACDNGYLFNLDRGTGKEIWRYDLGDGRVNRPLGHQVLDKLGIGEFDYDNTAPRPLLADGVIYIGSGHGSFHAVSSETGARLWRFSAEGKLRTTAALSGRNVIFGSFNGVVYAVDRRDGSEVWRKETRAEVTSSPLVIGDRILIGNRGGLLAALNAATGDVIWRMLFWGSSVESSPEAVDSSLFVIGSSDLRRVSLVDSKDGRVIWRTDIFGVPWAQPAVAGDIVYACAMGVNPYEIRHLPSLTALDCKTGTIIWRWPAPVSTAFQSGFIAGPVIHEKTILVGGLDGVLYAFPME